MQPFVFMTLFKCRGRSRLEYAFVVRNWLSRSNGASLDRAQEEFAYILTCKTSRTVIPVSVATTSKLCITASSLLTFYLSLNVYTARFILQRFYPLFRCVCPTTALCEVAQFIPLRQICSTRSPACNLNTLTSPENYTY